jgi:O-antigen/teichoic acid export membrane protein
MSIRRLLRDLAIYGSGDLALRATGLLTLPIYTRVFTPTEYGVWNFLLTLTFFLNAVLLLGADAAYTRLYFANGDERSRQVLTSTLVAFLAVTVTLIVLVALPFSAVISKWSFGTRDEHVLVLLTLLAAPLVVVNTILSEALRNQFRAALYACLNVATALLAVGLSLAFVLGFDKGVEGVLLGSLLAAAAILPVRVWVTRALLRPRFSLGVLREALAFGLPLVPAAAALWTFAVSDRIILGKQASLRELGLYTVATSVASLLTFLFAPLGQAWTPHAYQAYERDPDAARAFYGRVLTYIVVAFGLLCVAVTAFADQLLRVLTPAEFRGASVAVAPLALGAVAYATIYVTSLAFGLRRKTAYVPALLWIAATANVALNLLLVPAYGIRASAWATAASSVLLTVLYFAVSQRLWPIAYETRRVLTAGVAIVGFTMAAHFLPDLPLASALLLETSLCAAFVLSLFLLGVLGRVDVESGRTLLRGQRAL